MFAVIDTETTYADEVMSIGIVMADEETFRPVDARYYIIAPAYQTGGMFSHVLQSTERCTLPFAQRVCSRRDALEDLRAFMARYGADTIFAYNANFDRSHLPELRAYNWGDIMWAAAYRQFNPTIPADADCYATGRLKCGCGVEATLRRLLGRADYYEVHNALADAVDELLIMRLLAHPLCLYQKPAKPPRAAR